MLLTEEMINSWFKPVREAKPSPVKLNVLKILRGNKIIKNTFR